MLFTIMSRSQAIVDIVGYKDPNDCWPIVSYRIISKLFVGIVIIHADKSQFNGKLGRTGQQRTNLAAHFKQQTAEHLWYLSSFGQHLGS